MLESVLESFPCSDRTQLTIQIYYEAQWREIAILQKKLVWSRVDPKFRAYKDEQVDYCGMAEKYSENGE